MTDTSQSATRVPALMALLLGLVGLAALVGSSLTGVASALSVGEEGQVGYGIVMVIAGLLLLAGLVLSIVCLVRGLARGLAVAALVVSLIPLVVAIVVVVATLV